MQDVTQRPGVLISRTRRGRVTHGRRKGYGHSVLGTRSQPPTDRTESMSQSRTMPDMRKRAATTQACPSEKQYPGGNVNVQLKDRSGPEPRSAEDTVLKELV